MLSTVRPTQTTSVFTRLPDGGKSPVFLGYPSLPRRQSAHLPGSIPRMSEMSRALATGHWAGTAPPPNLGGGGHYESTGSILHAIGSKTARRHAAPQPVLTRATLRSIA